MTELEKQLLSENNDLRIRLAETNMQLNAITNVKPDASNDLKSENEENLMLSTIEEPYKVIIEEMNEGACTLDEDNTIIYSNQQFADFLAAPIAQIIGSNFTKLLPERDKTIVDLLTKARANGKSQGEFFYTRHTEEQRHMFLSLRSIASEKKGILFILITDITNIRRKRLTNEELLNNARMAALNIMEDEIAAKKTLAKTNRKLIEEIRERKKTADELQKNKFILLQAQQLAHIGNWTFDLASKEVTWSEEISKILRIEHIDKPFLDYQKLKTLFDKDTWLRISEASKIAMETGVIKELEAGVHCANGEDRTVIIVCNPQVNTEGRVIRLNGIVQDITERKKSEDELLKVNRLYNVISQVNQMIVRNQVRETIFTEACNIVVDYGEFRMAWIGLLDEKRENIIPVTWAGAELGYLSAIKSISAQNTPEGNGPTGTAIRQGKLYYCNDIANDPKMSRWKDEAIKRNFHSSIALPITVQNKIIGAFTIYVAEANFFNQAEIDLLFQVTNDISFALEVAVTEKKRISAERSINKINAELEQRVIQRTQQLESTNKELEAFTYSVSHDLRAPLRNINGWSHVLLEECKESLGVNGIKYLDRVISEAGRMGNLIDDLLKLSRVTLVEKKREKVDLTGIALSISNRLMEKDPDNKVEFIIQPGLVTFGDAQMLEIALTNLLDNAFKFTGKIDNPRIEFGSSIIREKPAYWVKDNGVGFDMANSKNLFGAFQRMHNQTEFPGTGIGLATVQRIIHRHNGEIWAESEVDIGTIFYFTIPEDIL